MTHGAELRVPVLPNQPFLGHFVGRRKYALCALYLSLEDDGTVYTYTNKISERSLYTRRNDLLVNARSFHEPQCKILASGRNVREKVPSPYGK